jgi:hypothetical protein
VGFRVQEDRNGFEASTREVNEFEIVDVDNVVSLWGGKASEIKRKLRSDYDLAYRFAQEIALVHKLD